MSKINFDSQYIFYTLIDKLNPIINGLILPSVGDMELGFVQRTLSNSLFSRIFDSFSDLVSLLDISGNTDSDLMEKILLCDEDILIFVEDLIKTNSDQKDFLNSLHHFHFVLCDFLHFYRKSYVSIIDNEGYEILDDTPICSYIENQLRPFFDKLNPIIKFNEFIRSVLKSL